jgi:hypothetical protein
VRSAIYGADGVSGVVNFRMKQDFEGFASRLQVGNSRHGDGGNRFASLAFGHNFADGRGNFAIAYEYNADDRVGDQDRAFLRTRRRRALSEPRRPRRRPETCPTAYRRTMCLFRQLTRSARWTSTAMACRISRAPGVPTTAASSWRTPVVTPSAVRARALRGYQGDLFPKLRRNLVNAFGHFDVNDGVTLFAEAKYAESHAFSFAQPTFDYTCCRRRQSVHATAIAEPSCPGAAAFFEDDSVPDGLCDTRQFRSGINVKRQAQNLSRRDRRERPTLGSRKLRRCRNVGQHESQQLRQQYRITDRWNAAIEW